MKLASLDLRYLDFVGCIFGSSIIICLGDGEAGQSSIKKLSTTWFPDECLEQHNCYSESCIIITVAFQGVPGSTDGVLSFLLVRPTASVTDESAQALVLSSSILDRIKSKYKIAYIRGHLPLDSAWGFVKARARLR